MINYHTIIVAICLSTLSVLSIMVHENNRITRKYMYYVGYLIIALAAIAEWLGVFIDGNANISQILLKVVKVVDYILTPAVGIAFVLQMKPNTIVFKILIVLLLVNTVFQITAGFTGWMTVIDSNNHYAHGQLYAIYIVIYALVIIIVLSSFFVFSLPYKKGNHFSLYLTIMLIVAGIAVQEIFHGEYRISYLVLSIASILFFVWQNEFSQVKLDDSIISLKLQSQTDQLTGFLNRNAFYKMINDSNTDLTNRIVCAISIQKLNKIILEKGYRAADDVIRNLADYINNHFAEKGTIFSISDGEFIVITRDNTSFEHDLLAFSNDIKQYVDDDCHYEIYLGVSLATNFPSYNMAQLCIEAQRNQKIID